MTIVGVVIHRDEPALTAGGEISRRLHRRAMKAAHYKIGEHWHKKYMPLHFRDGAAARYKYQFRAKSTMAKKRRKKVPPLVWTGTMKRVALTPKLYRAYPTRVTIAFSGPSYATIRRKSPKLPNLVAEATAVTAEESADLEQVAGEEYQRQLEQFQERRRSRSTAQCPRPRSTIPPRVCGPGP